jgi:hypothetical protein
VVRYDDALQVELGEQVNVGLRAEARSPSLTVRRRLRAADRSHVDDVSDDQMTVQPSGVLRL